MNAIAPLQRTWSVGTLVYAWPALMSVFFWMLWGDLCVQIFESVIPRLLPMRLTAMGVGSTMIGFMSVSLMAIVELLVNPFVSTYSDRFRSRIGRRRPFILACTPVLALCLVAVGFTDEMAGWVHRHIGSFGISQTALTLWILGIALVLFQFFNVVVMATYYYMIADVVPQPVIGTFTSLYRICAMVGSNILFMMYLFPLADRHESKIYVGCAVVYLVSFLLVGWRVKEGEYPPPEPLPSGGAGAVVAHWLRESFAIRFYQKLYLIGLTYYFATMGSTVFQQLYALNELKLSREVFSSITALASVISLPVFFVMGLLSDRFHSLRMGMVGMGMMFASHLASHFLIHDETSFKLWTIVNAVTQTVWLGSQISLLPRLLPIAKYGQYASSNNTLCAIGKFGGPIVSGAVIGYLGSYRFNYIWTAIISVLGLIAVYVVYRHWKRLGGDLSYTPPTLEPPRGFDVIVDAPDVKMQRTIPSPGTPGEG